MKPPPSRQAMTTTPTLKSETPARQISGRVGAAGVVSIGEQQDNQYVQHRLPSFKRIL